MVLGSIYGYASSYYTGASSPPQTTTATRKRHSHTPSLTKHSPARPRQAADGSIVTVPEGEEERYGLVDEINAQTDLYKVLGVARSCRTEDLRRAYISRSRVVHPDKFQNYPESTAAFQKLSLAYETLSKPSSRKLYDLSGRHEGGFSSADGGLGDETLHGVLATVFKELLEGDFAIIRVLITALNDGHPGLNLGEDAIDSLEGVFARMRSIVLSSQKYLRVIKFELCRLYEIQSSLRSLSYFDIRGRLRLTLQLGIVALSIPMAIDQAIGTDPAEPVASEEDGKEVVRRSLLGPRLADSVRTR